MGKVDFEKERMRNKCKFFSRDLSVYTSKSGHISVIKQIVGFFFKIHMYAHERPYPQIDLEISQHPKALNLASFRTALVMEVNKLNHFFLFFFFFPWIVNFNKLNHLNGLLKYTRIHNHNYLPLFFLLLLYYLQRPLVYKFLKLHCNTWFLWIR